MNTENNCHLSNNEIRAVMKSISRLLQSKACENDFGTEILCAEIAMRCFTLSDEMEQEQPNNAGLLTWHETAHALKRIAVCAAALPPDADDEGGLQTAWKASMAYIAKNADYVCRLLGFPFSVSGGVVTDALTAPEAPLPPTVYEAPDRKDRWEPPTALAVYTEDNARQRLLREIQALRDELAKLAAEKTYLENDELLRLSAAYAVNIGGLLSELYLAEVDLNKARRTLQMMQASLNRKEQPDMQDIEEQLQQENEQFRAKYEDFVHREQEAREYQQKRAENEERQREWHEEHERRRETADRYDGEKDTHSDAGSAYGNEPEPDTKPDGTQENIADYMKSLYRKLVKALHPDLHPDQSPEEAELFKRVTVAYANRDLQALVTAWELLQNGRAAADRAEKEDKLEQLIREKLRLMDLVEKLRKEITEIMARFPFTMRDILDDPEKLAAKQNEIRKKINETKAMAAHFEARIEELKKKL